jgi:molybdopterin/thiamine biosynthesis adenylyltransferase
MGPPSAPRVAAPSVNNEEPGNRLGEILRGVKDLGLFRDPRSVPIEELNGESAALDGEVLVDGRWVTVRLVLDNPLPRKLPRFYLRPWDALGFIPHVQDTGLVCFTDPEGLILDRRRPLDVVREAFDQVLRVLTDGASGRNHADFSDEFEAYWAQLAGGVDLRSILDPVDHVHGVLIASRKDETALVAGTQEDLSTFWNGAPVGGKYTLQNAVYVPLEPDTILIPPRPDQPMWSVDDARLSLVPRVSAANQRQLSALIKGRTRGKEYVIVRLPRPAGGDTLFGIRFDEVGDVHPLLTNGTAKRLVPLKLERLDRSHLVRRGGGDADLRHARVLLLGCGALGGHLAFEFARAGIGELTLVDRDLLKPENTYRHVLGRRYWGKYKALALADAIKEQVPFVEVTGIVDSVETVLDQESIDVSSYDLIVSALGNPTVELAINEHLHKLQNGPAALFAWLEPLGIGGHALLVTDGSSAGCFECLYTSPDGEGTLNNRAAFAAPGQSFGRALSGCGSLHTPYGSIDSVCTATLGVRLAIAALTGKETGNPLVSWKGEASLFEAEGYRVSPRYGASENELHQQRYAYQSPYCPVCDPGRRAA